MVLMFLPSDIRCLQIWKKKEKTKPKRWRTDKSKKKQMFSQIRLRWLRAIDQKHCYILNDFQKCIYPISILCQYLSIVNKAYDTFGEEQFTSRYIYQLFVKTLAESIALHEMCISTINVASGISKALFLKIFRLKQMVKWFTKFIKTHFV